jgi:hypothetical protein
MSKPTVILDLAINISYYAQEIQRLMDLAINESQRKLGRPVLLEEDRVNIFLTGAGRLAKALEEDIHREVTEKEGKSYEYCSNEMNMLALSTILACWSGWVFKAKSVDPGRPKDSRELASAVNKYVGSLVRNAINAGQQLGEDGKPAYGKNLSIEISEIS